MSTLWQYWPNSLQLTYPARDMLPSKTSRQIIRNQRKCVCDNLDTFAAVSDDDVHKLVMKSKTTSYVLDPMPTKLVK